LVRILVPFLKKGLVGEVYGRMGEDECVGEGVEALRSVTGDWEKWYEWNSKAVNGGST
jgi:hypothetical protein